MKSLRSLKSDLLSGMKEAGAMTGVEMVPRVEVSPDQAICPLTNRQKFNLFLRDSYSPLTVISAGFNASFSQWTEGRQGYGQGWDAYGSRFGAELAYTEISGLFQTAVFPILTHEDPRYFRAGKGTFGHRLWFAVTRVAVARKDGGGHRFNYSEVLGALLAGAASNAYVIDSDRTASRTLTSVGVGIGADAAWNAMKEFAPDVWRRLTRQEKQQAPSATTHP